MAHPIVHEALQPDPQPLPLRAVEELAVQHLHARSQRAGAAPQPGDRHAVPDQRAVVAEREGGVGRGLHHGDAARHLLAQRPPCGTQHEALLVALGGRVGKEAETVDAADGVALDDDLAAAGDRRQQFLGLARLQPAHQMRGAAIDEAAGQPFVQRVRQQFLDLARPALPVRAVQHPVAAGGDIGPHPHAGEPLHQRVDVAVRAGQRADLRGKPVGRQTLVARDVAEHPGAELGVRVVRQLAEVGDLAGLPQPPHHPPPVREAADVRIVRQGGQRFHIGRVVALDQARAGRRRHQRGEQRVHVREVEIAVAPAELVERLEAVRLHRGRHLIAERVALRGGAERPVAHAAAGAAGDLRHLGRGEAARAVAVELPHRGERHVVHVHVEAHADRVGGDQEIDLLGLIQRHLGVAGARREPAHHHRAAAAPAADQLGDGVDLGGGERDHGGARRQAHQLGGADVAELRQPGPRLDAGLRHQAMQQRPDRLGAEEHGLDHAAGVQQPVGEDVAAVGVGAELDLVHRQELGVAVERHGLDGAGEPARLGRDDLLLAGDQGDVAGALLRHHPVVVLAGEQAEGEADDAGGVRQQALDGEMGLAGVRRAEDGFDAGGETGVETGHGEMVGCCGAECKRRGGQIGWGGDRVRTEWAGVCAASTGV